LSRDCGRRGHKGAETDTCCQIFQCKLPRLRRAHPTLYLKIPINFIERPVRQFEDSILSETNPQDGCQPAVFQFSLLAKYFPTLFLFTFDFYLLNLSVPSS
jgi:hypothetical protein